MNGAIRAKEVRVVAPDGSQIGVKKLNEALWLAEQLDLDLVEVAPNAKPPVCRLMDYGKYKYEQSVKQREARKKQTRTTIKELRMKVRIGDHDFDITKRKAKDFLAEGDKVKVTIRFRGREQERPGFGKDLLDRLAEDLLDVECRGAGAQDRGSKHDDGAGPGEEGKGRRREQRRELTKTGGRCAQDEDPQRSQETDQGHWLGQDA